MADSFYPPSGLSPATSTGTPPSPGLPGNPDMPGNPEAFPAYEDLISGKAPLPDIPVFSFNPLIIPPPPPVQTQAAPPVVTFNFQSIKIVDPGANEVKRQWIEECERRLAWGLTRTANTGGGW